MRESNSVCARGREFEEIIDLVSFSFLLHLHVSRILSSDHLPRLQKADYLNFYEVHNEQQPPKTRNNFLLVFIVILSIKLVFLHHLMFHAAMFYIFK